MKPKSNPFNVWQAYTITNFLLHHFMYQFFFTCSSLEGFNYIASLPFPPFSCRLRYDGAEKWGGWKPFFFSPLVEFFSVSLFDTDRRGFYFYEEVEGGGHVISCLTTKPSVESLTLGAFPYNGSLSDRLMSSSGWRCWSRKQTPLHTRRFRKSLDHNSKLAALILGIS